MRLVKTFAPALIALLLMLFTPLVAAAASAETVPAVDYAMQAPLWMQVSLVGLATGITVHLTAKNVDTDEEESINLDTEDRSTLINRLKHYVGLKTRAATKPLQEQLTASQEENSGLRDIIVGEILRVKKLTQTGEDGEPSFNVEKEKKYLEGLPAERLKMEYERIPQREELKVESVTKSAGGEEGNDLYEGMR